MRKWIPREPIMVAAVTVTSFVALIAFLASFQHQYELVIFDDQTHWVAALYPLSIDFLVVATTLGLWYSMSKGWYAESKWYLRPWGVWLVFMAGVGASATANLAADNPGLERELKPFVSLWPALAFVGAYETVVWMMRKKRKMDQGEKPLPSSIPPASMGIPDLGRTGPDPSSNGHKPDKVAPVLASGRVIQRKPDKPGQKPR